MTDSKGAAVPTKAGERVTYKIGPQDDAGAIARHLTLHIHRMVRGESGPAGFNPPLEYPASGVA
jgi:hypothetical protein